MLPIFAAIRHLLVIHLWSCYFGLGLVSSGLGLKNLVLFTSPMTMAVVFPDSFEDYQKSKVVMDN